VPELPEAETIARTLAPHIEGRRILEVRFLSKRARRGPFPRLEGRVVCAARRYGKRIEIELDDGFLVFELRMTGLLRWRGAPEAHTRAWFRFEHGLLCFDDVRQFGSVAWRQGPPGGLGPDAVGVTADELAGRLEGRRAQLKRLLLDQHFLRGLGNIYADEVLHRAGLHPARTTAGLDKPSVARLHKAMREVLREAIAHGGSSISDYVDTDGRKGGYQFLHRVYGREGKPCGSCGGPIRRIVVAQRGTHYCPRCQGA
jgi:formamidopyrimidine-DNA glycosylase